MTPSLPRISFGMIVLNGEPFVRYNLRALYPFAHQIIVVEGAAPAAAGIATPGGHSTDGTLETLQRFKVEEDPDDKLIIVSRDGFWEGEKDEMSRAYAECATGDYLWQVDSDEFYKPEDMRTLLKMLHDDPGITAMSFKQLQFWGGIDYITDGWYLRRGAGYFHRLFKWGPDYTYVTHRPPTVTDPQGRDLRSLKWITGQQLEQRGIVMYHYSLVFPKQVLEKSAYYQSAAWGNFPEMQSWATDTFLHLRRPFRVHNVYHYPSWLERFEGSHPPQILAMWDDIRNGKITIERRPTEDIERLLNSSVYKSRRYIIRRQDYVDRRIKGNIIVQKIDRIVRRLRRLPRRVLRESYQLLHPDTVAGTANRQVQSPKPYLNLGCGIRFHPDWTNVDIVSTSPFVQTRDLRQRFPFPDNTFEVVYHSHLLEYFSRDEADRFLRECYRVLKPGGIIRIVISDLETIARLYLQALNNARDGDPEWQHNYEWIKLELLDRLVRRQSGGGMAAYLQQQEIPNESFIYSRLGQTGRQLVQQMQAERVNPAPQRPRRRWRSYLHPAHLKNAIYTWLVQRILTHDDVVALRVGRFAQQGEVHQWMYDRFSLARLLETVGFEQPVQKTAVESAIPNWTTYNLDTESDGTVCKPDSLFMEAHKRSQP